MLEDIEQIYKRTEQYGRIQFVEEIDKLQCEKQQLISFLEDKINHLEEIIYKSKIKPYGEELHLLENSLNRYKEVLDYAKGGKDEINN